MRPQHDAPITIYLIDDLAMIRAALRALLSQDKRFAVAGDTADARRGILEIERLRPDVVLLDISMPGLSGIDAIAYIRKSSPRTKIIMLSHLEGQTFVEQALRAGAEGYLSKNSSDTELTIAIEAVHGGNPYVSPKVSSGLISQVRGETLDQPASILGQLTPREREVFQLLAIGKSNKQVALQLDVTLATAKKHRENLQRKLDCHSAAELALLAIREGLLAG